MQSGSSVHGSQVRQPHGQPARQRATLAASSAVAGASMSRAALPGGPPWRSAAIGLAAEQDDGEVGPCLGGQRRKLIGYAPDGCPVVGCAQLRAGGFDDFRGGAKLDL